MILQNKIVLSLIALAVLSSLMFAFSNNKNPNLILSKSQRIKFYDGESKIYGRLAKSKQDGVFSSAGLLGNCYTDNRNHLENRPWSPRPGKEQLRNYYAGTCEAFVPYKSQSGGQAIVYFFLSKFSEDPRVFHGFCALFLAIVLTAWFIWMIRYFGWFVALGTSQFILLFKGLVLLSGNLAQVLGATYLIMVGMFWAYQKNVKNLGLVAFSLVFLKLLLNGAEYIFTAVLLPFIPLVFYAVLNKTSLNKVLSEAYAIFKGVFLACYVAFLVLLLQISIAQSFSKAAYHFIDRFLSRTFFPTQNNLPYYFPLMKIELPKVLDTFLNLIAIDVGKFSISYRDYGLFLVFVSLLAYLLYRSSKNRVLLALLITTWVSILCPLAWLVLAKGHSAVHVFIDHLVWHMPFTLLGAALTTLTFKHIFEAIVQDLKHYRASKKGQPKSE